MNTPPAVSTTRHPLGTLACLMLACTLTSLAPAQTIPVRDIQNGDALAASIADDLAKQRADALAKADALIERSAAWLLATQHSSGGFGIYEGAPVFPAITGLVVSGLMDDTRPASHPAMQKAADFVLSHQKPDGAIYDKLMASYNTAICVSMLSRFPDTRCRDAMRKGAEFLKGLQYGEGAVEMAQLGPESAKPVERSHAYYGGVGYGKHGRPDLSNTAFWVEALSDAGVDKNDPAFLRAITFLERTQQIESAGGRPVNEMPYAKGSNQGGFIYATSINKDNVGSGQSFAGEIAESMSGPPGTVARLTFKTKNAEGKPVLLSKETIIARVREAISASSTRDVAAIGEDFQVLLGPGESTGAGSCEVRARCDAPERFADVLRAAFKDELASASAAPIEHWKAESRLRAYGSMTYAGFKSYLYAGLTKDDPRVTAAKRWIAANYTLSENPGVGTDGQYYYYVMFAKAMAASGDASVLTPGGARDWRVDLINQLATLQNEDGSFRSVDDRWMESDPVLITAYSLNALQAARKSLR